MKKTIVFILLLACPVFVVAGESSWQPFFLEKGLIKFKVYVEGVEGYAIVDTGRERSSVNKAFIEDKKLSTDVLNYVKVSGIFGEKRRPRYKDVDIEINGVTYQQNLYEVSFGPPRNAVMLGADFLKNVVVDIDYRNQRIRFFSNRDEIDVVSNVPLTKQRGTGYPIILVNLNDEDERWVILDTAHSGGVLLEKRVATQNNWFKRFSSSSSLVMGVNSMGYHNVIDLPKIKLGPYEVEKVQVAVPETNRLFRLTSQYEQEHSRIRGRRVEGLIGYEALKHFRLLFDYRSGSTELSQAQASE